MAYQTINNIFQINESDLTAAEAHGLATGMLCIENQTLVSLFEQTRKLLNDEEDSFRYDLFLPGEDDPMGEQLEALRSWCEGFLFGVGYTRSSSDWPGETGEVMKDIVEFTKLETHADEEMDADEAALIEIQEYLRVAVMMVKEQFMEENSEHKH
jgi:uncharacterized protein YgfB (UPF0149 family)